MRISDWSSDVCSSDLCVHAQAGLCDIAPAPRIETLADGQRVRCLRAQEISAGAPPLAFPGRRRARPESRLRLEGVTRIYGGEIGRASVRERGCHKCQSRWGPYHKKKKKYNKT